ncbi:hypothetical protein [Bacillus smithii]|uniref:hypothetical protein n=1 Tax=Bacillus smithii TaxID=1479 RepID=UPI002E1E4395|nr:hypothetical protein [Bacillus smithii]MED4927855.1 hypothetical protein [Bacillus smithii]
MKDVLTSIVIPLVVGIVPAFISFLGARYQANSALQTVKEQQQAELQKLKEQHSVDLQKLREQQQAELEKLKEQQNAEIQRIREQSLRDIERIVVDSVTTLLKKKWINTTSKAYIEYNGIGTHDELLNPEYIQENVEIIKQILNKIKEKAFKEMV